MLAFLRSGRLVRSLRGEGLRAKAMRASGWTLVGFMASQVLRLGSNLVLTRLLFPKAFGLMVLANVFLQGLVMLSDIGVEPAIVQNKRGDEPEFLATAWTMQICRGLFLSLLVFLAAYPISLIYNEPDLFPILAWFGLTVVIHGFQTIGVASATRKLKAGHLTLLDLTSQFAGIVVMILWAYYQRSVWALVGGAVASAITRFVMGHLMFRSSANRLRFDRSAAKEIIRFGRWIFVATGLTYAGGEGLKLLQGYLISRDTLAMISIAGMFGLAAETLAKQRAGSVLFPAFADIHLNRPHALASRNREARLKLLLITAPIFVVLILLGRDLIYWLYDPRYYEAALFLVISATGFAISSQRATFGSALIATGDAYGHAVIMAANAVSRIVAIFIGFTLYGVVGMLIADIVGQVAIYPIEAWRLKSKGLWIPSLDIPVFLAYASLGVLSYVTGPYF